LVVVIFVSESVASAQSATPPTLKPVQPGLNNNDFSIAVNGPVAYIFYTDTVARDDFATFLSARGFQVDLVALTGTATFNFSTDHSIIIGNDTGSHNAWGTPAAVNNVVGSGKQVLGVGEGGYAFFGQQGLVVGYPNGQHLLSHAVYVMDPAQPYFRCSIPIAIPPNRTLALYTSDVDDVEILLPSSMPSGITLIGSVLGDQTHYSMIGQWVGSQNYLLWGFTGAPSAMTQIGQDLFINILCATLSNKLYLPLISRGP
jgi:hypothetical protein